MIRKVRSIVRHIIPESKFKSLGMEPWEVFRWELKLECGHSYMAQAKGKPTRKKVYCVECREVDQAENQV